MSTAEIVTNSWTLNGQEEYLTVNGVVLKHNVAASDLPKFPSDSSEVRMGSDGPTYIASWADGWTDTITVRTTGGPEPARGTAVPLNDNYATQTVASGTEPRAGSSNPVAAPTVTAVTRVPSQDGDQIVVAGSRFGTTQGSGFVQFSNGDFSFASPGGFAGADVEDWTDQRITIRVPVSARAALSALRPYALIVVNDDTGRSAPIHLAAATTPVITSMSPTRAGPGTLVVVNGSNFGSQGPASGQAALTLVDGNDGWGGYLSHPLAVVAWSDTQIAFIVPTQGADGSAVVPGSTASVQVYVGTGYARQFSNIAALTVTTGVECQLRLTAE